MKFGATFIWTSLVVLMAVAPTAMAQSDTPVFIDVGSRDVTGRRITRIAAGEIISILATTKRVPSVAVRAPGGLPVAELAGIKLSWERRTAALLFSVEPWADGLYTLITAQLPFEIPASGIGAASIGASGGGCGELYLSVDGVESAGWRICPILDRIRLLGTSCSVLYSTACTGEAVHQTGGAVTSLSPAVPGEVLTVYAVGLGYMRRTPGASISTGVMPLVTDTLVFPPKVIFEYSSDPVVRRRVPVPNGGLINEIRPEYMGAVPGQLGLYQINFVVPPYPPEVPRYIGSLSPNAMLSVAGVISEEGVGIFVKPPQ